MQTVSLGNVAVMFTGRAVGGVVNLFALHFYRVETNFIDIGCWRCKYACASVYR
jgi:hypothetical protein